MYPIIMVFGIFMSPSPTDSQAIMQAKAQLQFLDAKVEARESVEKAAQEYVRILEQIATTRDKAAQVLTKERIAKLLEAAQQARWNAAKSIIDDETIRIMSVANQERNRLYGATVSSKVTTTKRGAK